LFFRWLASTGILFLVCGFLDSASAFPDRVAVTLFEAHAPVAAVFAQGPLVVLQPGPQRIPPGQYEIYAGKAGVEIMSGQRHLCVRARRLVLQGAAGKVTLTYPGLPSRRYRGLVKISADKKGKLRIVNELDSRDYVTSVTGSETLPGWPLEALKCQAILTQTRLSRYKLGDELGDSTQREVYLGIDSERPAVRSAVHSVWGQLLTYDRRPVEALYHSTCAGGTSDAAKFFGAKAGSFPYLPGVTCNYCKRSPFFREKVVRIPAKVFDRLKVGPEPDIRSRDNWGRPLTVGTGGKTVITGYNFWLLVGEKLGWDKVPGTRFSLTRLPDGAVEIRSTGAGHGVGLCQWGAAGQALRGCSYGEILNFYFAGAKIQQR